MPPRSFGSYCAALAVAAAALTAVPAYAAPTPSAPPAAAPAPTGVTLDDDNARDDRTGDDKGKDDDAKVAAGTAQPQNQKPAQAQKQNQAQKPAQAQKQNQAQKPAQAQKQDQAQKPARGKYKGRVVAKSGLLLRDRPTRGSKVVGSVPYDAIVHIFCKTKGDTVKDNNRWYLLTDGRWAWSSAAYIDNIGKAPRWC